MHLGGTRTVAISDYLHLCYCNFLVCFQVLLYFFYGKWHCFFMLVESGTFN